MGVGIFIYRASTKKTSQLEFLVSKKPPSSSYLAGSSRQRTFFPTSYDCVPVAGFGKFLDPEMMHGETKPETLDWICDNHHAYA